MESIQAIDKILALTRVTEIQQRISDIEKKIGVSRADFQKTLEAEIARQSEKVQNIKPIEEFLAENKLPVNENAAANAEKVAAALNPTEKIPAEKIQTEKSPVEKIPAEDSEEKILLDKIQQLLTEYRDELREEIPTRQTQRYRESFSQMSTEQMLERAARKYGVEPELVKAVATAESNMNQGAVSQVGAVGVMQLMPETAASLGVNPYDEKENIEGGAHYIRQMLDQFNGNVSKAVAAYNAGPGAVQKYGGVPPYSETQNYVGRVLDFYVK